MSWECDAVLVLFVCAGQRTPTGRSSPSSKVISMFCIGAIEVRGRGGEGRGQQEGRGFKCATGVGGSFKCNAVEYYVIIG